MAAGGKNVTIVGKDDLVHQVAAEAGTNLKETNEILDACLERARLCRLYWQFRASSQGYLGTIPFRGQTACLVFSNLKWSPS
jgi:hypothetical protein